MCSSLRVVVLEFYNACVLAGVVDLGPGHARHFWGAKLVHDRIRKLRCESTDVNLWVLRRESTDVNLFESASKVQATTAQRSKGRTSSEEVEAVQYVVEHVSGLSGRRVDSSRIFSWGNVSGCAERGQTKPSPKSASICWRVRSLATCRRNDAFPQIECMGQGIWVWILMASPTAFQM